MSRKCGRIRSVHAVFAARAQASERDTLPSRK